MSEPLAAFAQALRDPALPASAELHAPVGGASLAERFSVHRNTVMVSLVEVLADTFPVLRELLGAECFDAMAQAHVLAAPPRSPVMAEYGAALPAWLDDFEPLAGLPWLGDVARLEFARLSAAGAADAPALQPATWDTLLAEADADTLATARLVLHPSVRRLRLRHAAVSVWRAHQLEPDERDALLSALDPLQPEQALVLRDPDDHVLVLPVTAEAADVADALAGGSPLGELLAAHGAAAFTGSIALLLRHGAVAALSAAPGASPPQDHP